MAGNNSSSRPNPPAPVPKLVSVIALMRVQEAEKLYLPGEKIAVAKDRAESLARSGAARPV